MKERSELIRDLQSAAEGSPEFDVRIARLLNPDKQVVISDGGVHRFVDAQSRTAHVPIPQYTSSLDAGISGEDIVRVEKLPERKMDRWRAWLSDGTFAHAKTEAIARRVARLTQMATQEQEARPHPRKAYDCRSSTFKDRDKATRANSSISSGSFTGSAEQLVSADDIANHKLIIEVLCEHIRSQRVNSPAPEPSPDLFHDKTVGSSTIGVKWDARFQPMVTQESSASAATLFDGVSNWHKEARPRLKNLERVSRTVRRFVELHGNRPMNSYTKGEVREFLATIRKLPQYPPGQIRRLPVPVLLRHARDNPGAERVTPGTVRAHLKDLQLVFNWAMGRGSVRAQSGTQPASR